MSAITKCNDLSTPGLDHILWKYLKAVIKNKSYLINIINITNTCITSLSIIIPKPNKVAYNSLKMFQPIILLNTLGKLIKKAISERL